MIELNADTAQPDGASREQVPFQSILQQIAGTAKPADKSLRARKEDRKQKNLATLAASRDGEFQQQRFLRLVTREAGNSFAKFGLDVVNAFGLTVGLGLRVLEGEKISALMKELNDRSRQFHDVCLDVSLKYQSGVSDVSAAVGMDLGAMSFTPAPDIEVKFTNLGVIHVLSGFEHLDAAAQNISRIQNALLLLEPERAAQLAAGIQADNASMNEALMNLVNFCRATSKGIMSKTG